MVTALNPSRADELINDNTVTRCINFAQNWGYAALLMTNIFGYRATNPKIMKAQADPVGPENDKWLKWAQSQADIVVCAWGNDGDFRGRAAEVLAILKKPYCLKINEKTGHPAHPLYLRGNLKPILLK